MGPADLLTRRTLLRRSHGGARNRLTASQLTHEYSIPSPSWHAAAPERTLLKSSWYMRSWWALRSTSTACSPVRLVSLPAASARPLPAGRPWRPCRLPRGPEPRPKGRLLWGPCQPISLNQSINRSISQSINQLHLFSTMARCVPGDHVSLSSKPLCPEPALPAATQPIWWSENRVEGSGTSGASAPEGVRRSSGICLSGVRPGS